MECTRDLLLGRDMEIYELENIALIFHFLAALFSPIHFPSLSIHFRSIFDFSVVHLSDTELRNFLNHQSPPSVLLQSAGKYRTNVVLTQV